MFMCNCIGLTFLYNILNMFRKGRLSYGSPYVNPFMPTGAFNICCPRDCVSRHNGGTSGAPLKPPRDDSVLRALSTLRGLRGAPEVPPLCRETQSLGQQMLNAPVGINGLRCGSEGSASSVECLIPCGRLVCRK